MQYLFKYFKSINVMLITLLINWVGFVGIANECESLLSDGSDLVAEEMKFGMGWNSTTTTVSISQKKIMF